MLSTITLSISDYIVYFLNIYNLEAIHTLKFCMVCYEIGQKPGDYPILILFKTPRHSIWLLRTNSGFELSEKLQPFLTEKGW